MSEVTVRIAEGDDDVINLHKFLCVVAGPRLPGPIHPVKSIEEVWRVVNEEYALAAERDGNLIGTFGIIEAIHWWGDVKYLTNRWLFAVPGANAWRPLLTVGKSIAEDNGLELVIYAEERGKVVILNRHPQRDAENPHLALLQ